MTDEPSQKWEDLISREYWDKRFETSGEVEAEDEFDLWLTRNQGQPTSEVSGAFYAAFKRSRKQRAERREKREESMAADSKRMAEAAQASVKAARSASRAAWSAVVAAVLVGIVTAVGIYLDIRGG